MLFSDLQFDDMIKFLHVLQHSCRACRYLLTQHASLEMKIRSRRERSHDMIRSASVVRPSVRNIIRDLTHVMGPSPAPAL